MTCPKKVFVDNLGDDTKYNNDPRIRNYEYPQQK